MKKMVVIHQPDFLPYLGFFHRLLRSDLYVILDNVQFVHSSRGWTHRDKIKSPQGQKWLTVSVKKAPRSTAINQIQLSQGTEWKTDNINLIRESYKFAPHFSEIFPFIEELYAFSSDKLVDFNMESLRMLMKLLGIEIPMIFASQLNPQGHKNELIIDILKKVNASHYLSGVGAKDYFEPESFTSAQLEVVWQKFSHPIYPQIYGDYIPYLSSIDILFNCGIKNSRDILARC